MGSDPSVYGDFDDWRMLRWGFCETLSRKAAPSGTDDYIRTAYADPERCGRIPLFAEPTDCPTCSVIGPPPDDRVLYPWIYESRESECL